MSDSKTISSTTEIKFKKLGFLALDTNEKTSYELRELKTVFIEATCLYLRIAFHKCHNNKINFFQQVGMIALAAFGEQLGGSPVKGLNYSTEKPEVPIRMDEATTERLRELEEAKKKAADAEQFVEAHHIKQEIKRIKKLAMKVEKTEDKLNEFVKIEDYGNAEVCKKEIIRLKEMIMQKDNLSKQKQSRGSVLHDSYESQKDSITDFLIETKTNSAAAPTERIQSPTSNDAKTEVDFDPNVLNPDFVEGFSGVLEELEEDRKLKKGKVAYDEQVIPALTKKNKNLQEHDDGSGLIKEAEDIAPARERHAEPLLPILGEALCKKLFSKHWNLREEALNIVISEVPKGEQSKVIKYQEPGATFVSLFSIVGHTITDRINQVSAKSEVLLKLLLSQKTPQNNPALKADIGIYVDVILNALLEKMGDNNSRVREQAEEAFLEMTKNPLITCNHCVHVIISKAKNAQSIKHILGRLQLLNRIINEYKINNHDVPYHPVLDYVVEKLEHPNEKVRSAVVSLLIAIYMIVGNKIKTDLSNVGLAQMEMLNKLFEEASQNPGQPSLAVDKIATLTKSGQKKDKPKKKKKVVESQMPITYSKAGAGGNPFLKKKPEEPEPKKIKPKNNNAKSKVAGAQNLVNKEKEKEKEKEPAKEKEDKQEKDNTKTEAKGEIVKEKKLMESQKVDDKADKENKLTDSKEKVDKK